MICISVLLGESQMWDICVPKCGSRLPTGLLYNSGICLGIYYIPRILKQNLPVHSGSPFFCITQ